MTSRFSHVGCTCDPSLGPTMARGEGDSVYCEGCGGDLPDQVYAGPDGDGQAMFIRRADDEDAAIDESLEACRILGIDTSGDYNYLGTLRALVADVRRLTEEQRRDLADVDRFRGMARTYMDERDELRLEILALRGDKAGATSGRWVWTAPCWRIHGADGELLAKVATTNLLAWTRNGDIDAGGIEQATSVRDGMRRCEARLAGGAS